MNHDYRVIIGLEIHVQLQTQSKLFCGCSTKFGSDPNTQTCMVCTGMPGALPVLNSKALDLAIQAGLALNCSIEKRTKWDRKNYFYPDLPKGYQISQFDRPICFNGHVNLVDEKGMSLDKQIRIERAHLEEDAGKSNHDETGQGRESKIDLNRAGTPLLEIVTHPDLASAIEAKNFLNELKLILIYAGVSDCNMQKGNLRVDANVNVCLDADGTIFTPIVEIKNLNSFRAVERAITFEVERQIGAYQSSGETKSTAPKQTRGWNDAKQATYVQRDKEDSADYRYFPDPDLVAICTSDQEIQQHRNKLGDLPADIRKQLEVLGLSQYDSDVLVRQGKELIQYFQQTLEKVGDAKMVSNWIQQEVLRFLNENNSSIENYPVGSDRLSELLIAVANKKIDNHRAKDVLNKMVSENVDFESAKAKLGIIEVDRSEIEELCQQIALANPDAVADVKSGNTKAIGALIGQARKTNPNANPAHVRECLLDIINAS